MLCTNCKRRDTVVGFFCKLCKRIETRGADRKRLEFHREVSKRIANLAVQKRLPEEGMTMWMVIDRLGFTWGQGKHFVLAIGPDKVRDIIVGVLKTYNPQWRCFNQKFVTQRI